MAKRKTIDVTGGGNAAGPQTEPTQISAQPPKAVKASDEPELPLIDAPSVSPAISEPLAIDEPTIEPKPEPEVEAANRAPFHAPMVLVQPAAGPETDEPSAAEKQRFTIPPFAMRYARMAASVAFGAVIGLTMGAVLGGGFASKPQPPQVSAATLEENKAMQQSVARLTKEVTALKANLDATRKSAQTEVARANERIHQLQKEATEITGSISAPQTVAAVTEPTPLPTPRPRIAAAEAQPARQQVVQGWSVRDARGGYVYVEGNGDIYQIVPGAPLPGLGPVESVKRMEGRWVVTTPRGIIVSMRDRRYFE